jgi:uncharacterized protein involved in response to NO
MVQGFFGGFIFGFLGTAMPRLVGARPLAPREALALFALFLGNVAACAISLNTLGDWLFIGEITLWFALLKGRCHAGQDRPPPSFVLVGLSFASALAGTGLLLAGRLWELPAAIETLSRLLSFHAFVLLCMLGAGGFLLPRFLGLGARREFPESAIATSEWKRAARVAKSAGAAILLTYVLEAMGWNRIAGCGRAAVIVAYLWYAMPLERLRWDWRGVQSQLVLGLICIPLGVFAAGWWHSMRLTMAHLELIGGFALITTGIAARVVFGHSGAREKLERFHPWLTASVVLMVLGLATRMSGDFVPAIQATHYFYGALSWLAGMILWAICVLPRVLRPVPEA